jgi:hypothetical protein
MSGIVNRKEFYGGWLMLLVFAIVLFIFFSPVFGGKNGLDYLDNLYNSISKGSAYYIDKVKVETEKFNGQPISVTLVFSSEDHAGQTAILFDKAGAQTALKGVNVEIAGDLGQIFSNVLDDADSMYYNDGVTVAEKYGYNEKKALYNWWNALNEMDQDLKRQKLFKEAEAVTLIKKKAVETAYNYYKIDPQKINDNLWIVILSLVFYVVYTVWYGFAFMFIFEGWGLSLDH